ncbi:hypothetical protein SAMN04487949_1825 [Halogranum gelatinilyticum]|uniref:DUF7115 domain-containing protein n=1 Tax=Halogranum gelatinilyticum TaxID=660521 RepID=A0A1G9TLU8_9EURY|nr:hypothetical protein [Halogranum gelatinilyticum]SDM48663.1 hypothetical protein SAMN04487949_1825 [Halogranum gelatinilyticum]
MSLPELVQSQLGDESVAARVTLGGEDELFVTPTRTLIYRAEGLLSDESVEEYGHDAERLLVSEGRRKSKITLDYGLDGEETFAVPSKRLSDALHPVLAGILNAAGITDPGETVKHTFQFSELTLVITSARVVKHIGNAVWDEDFEEFHYDDVTDLDFEDGSVATTVVLTTGDRQERFKTPNENARAVREGLTEALLAHYDVASLEEFRVTATPDEDEEPPERDNVDFGDGPDPLSANPGELSEAPKNATRTDEEPTGNGADADLDSPAAVAESLEQPAGTATGAEAATASDGTDETGGFDGSGFESAVEQDGRVADELAALTEAVEQQNRELRKQRETMTQLIEELRQGR